MKRLLPLLEVSWAPQLVLVLFFIAFLVIVFQVYRPLARHAYDKHEKLPLREDDD